MSTYIYLPPLSKGAVKNDQNLNIFLKEKNTIVLENDKEINGIEMWTNLQYLEISGII